MQYGYLYHVLLDSPCLQTFKPEIPGTSSATNRLIRTIARNQLGNTFQYSQNAYSGQPFGATLVAPPPLNIGYYPIQPTPLWNPTM